MIWSAGWYSSDIDRRRTQGLSHLRPGRWAAPVLKNHRFPGAWELLSFESRTSDGTVTCPMGADPVGIIVCHNSGYVSAQLGPRNADGAGYVAYFGLLEAENAVEGTMVTRVLGASSARLRADQVRHFRFDGEDELWLSPPPGDDGRVMTLRWRRLSG